MYAIRGHHRRNIRFPAVTDQALWAARPKGPSSHLSVAHTMSNCGKFPTNPSKYLASNVITVIFVGNFLQI